MPVAAHQRRSAAASRAHCHAVLALLRPTGPGCCCGGTAAAARWRRQRRRRRRALSGPGSAGGGEAEGARATLAEPAVELGMRRLAKRLAARAARHHRSQRVARVVPSELRPAARPLTGKRSSGISIARRRVSGPPGARRRSSLPYVLDHLHSAVEGHGSARRHAQLQPRLPQREQQPDGEHGAQRPAPLPGERHQPANESHGGRGGGEAGWEGGSRGRDP